MFNNNPPLANSNTATTLANPTSPVFGNDGFLFVTETFIISPFSLISKVYSVSSNTYPSGAVIS